MHSSFFTPAIGLAILSFTSAGVIEKRADCWQDPAYVAMWGNAANYDSINAFCIGLLDLKGDTYCAANRTTTSISREAITATSTISTATTVAVTVTETETNTAYKFGGDVHAAMTSAEFLGGMRYAIKRQGGGDFPKGVSSACFCGSVAGSVQVTPTPEICTNTIVKTERGFAIATVYTRTVTSGTVTTTVSEDKTHVITTSKATASSYAPIAPVPNDTATTSSDASPTSGKVQWNDHWFNFGRKSSSSQSKVSSSTTEATPIESTTTSVATTETTETKTKTITTSTMTPEVETESSTTASSMTGNVWKDWADWHRNSSTRVLVDGMTTDSSIPSSTTTGTSTSPEVVTDSFTTTPSTTPEIETESTTIKPSTTQNVRLPWKDWGDWNHNSSTRVLVDGMTRDSSTTSPSKPTAVLNTTNPAWVDYNITKTSSSLPDSPTVLNTTSTSASAHQSPATRPQWLDFNITKTSSSLPDSPTAINTTSTSAAPLNTPTRAQWLDFNITRTTSAYIVHPTLVNDTSTTMANTTVSPTNITTSSISFTANVTTTANTTTSTPWVTPNITSTTASTSCLGQETVYLGNLTTTITETVNFTQPATTVTVTSARQRHRWYGW